MGENRRPLCGAKPHIVELVIVSCAPLFTEPGRLLHLQDAAIGVRPVPLHQRCVDRSVEGRGLDDLVELRLYPRHHAPSDRTGTVFLPVLVDRDVDQSLQRTATWSGFEDA